MSSPVNDSLDVNKNAPIDPRTEFGVGKDYETKEAIPISKRYPTLVTTDVLTKERWGFKGEGVNDADWILVAGYNNPYTEKSIDFVEPYYLTKGGVNTINQDSYLKLDDFLTADTTLQLSLGLGSSLLSNDKSNKEFTVLSTELFDFVLEHKNVVVSPLSADYVFKKIDKLGNVEIIPNIANPTITIQVSSELTHSIMINCAEKGGLVSYEHSETGNLVKLLGQTYTSSLAYEINPIHLSVSVNLGVLVPFSYSDQADFSNWSYSVYKIYLWNAKNVGGIIDMNGNFYEKSIKEQIEEEVSILDEKILKHNDYKYFDTSNGYVKKEDRDFQARNVIDKTPIGTRLASIKGMNITSDGFIDNYSNRVSIKKGFDESFFLRGAREWGIVQLLEKEDQNKYFGLFLGEYTLDNHSDFVEIIEWEATNQIYNNTLKVNSTLGAENELYISISYSESIEGANKYYNKILFTNDSINFTVIQLPNGINTLGVASIKHTLAYSNGKLFYCDEINGWYYTEDNIDWVSFDPQIDKTREEINISFLAGMYYIQVNDTNLTKTTDFVSFTLIEIPFVFELFEIKDSKFYFYTEVYRKTAYGNVHEITDIETLVETNFREDLFSYRLGGKLIFKDKVFEEIVETTHVSINDSLNKIFFNTRHRPIHFTNGLRSDFYDVFIVDGTYISSMLSNYSELASINHDGATIGSTEVILALKNYADEKMKANRSFTYSTAANFEELKIEFNNLLDVLAKNKQFTVS